MSKESAEQLLWAEEATLAHVNVRQVGRRRGPNRGRLDGGTMANIAVQRIKREFKEVLKSEEVGCVVGAAAAVSLSL